MRSALITGFWATSTIAVSSISYVATRMSGNLSDTMQEHAIASILSVSLSCLVSCITVQAAHRGFPSAMAPRCAGLCRFSITLCEMQFLIMERIQYSV